MHKHRLKLLATAAVLAFGGTGHAADMSAPMKAPPAPIPYTSSWAGGYVGGFIGAAHLDSTCQTAMFNSTGPFNLPCGAQPVGVPNGSTSQSATGFMAGAKIGYDWQSRSFVYGVLADWAWTGLKKSGLSKGR